MPGSDLSGLTGIQTQTPTRQIFLHLAPWQQAVFYVAGALSIAVFVWGFWRRVKKYRRGRAENRFDHLPRRLGRALVTILTNATVRRGEAFGGLAHTLILWGFLILFIGTCIVALDHDVPSVSVLVVAAVTWFNVTPAVYVLFAALPPKNT